MGAGDYSKHEKNFTENGELIPEALPKNHITVCEEFGNEGFTTEVIVHSKPTSEVIVEEFPCNNRDKSLSSKPTGPIK